MKCRVCGDVRRPKTSLVQGTVAQLRQLQRVISDLKLKKDELSHEIEVKFGDDNYLEYSQEIYYLLKIQQLSETIKVKSSEREKKILEITEKAIILQSKRAQLEALKEEKYQIHAKVASQRVTRECLLLSHQSDLVNDLALARWRKVFHLYIKFRLECHHPMRFISADPAITVKLNGISSILNLPLPNSGNYKDLPVEVVASALSHISHLVKSLSMILNIKLPHPLLPFDTFESAIIRSHGNLSKHVTLTPAFLSLAEVNKPPPLPLSQASTRENRNSNRDRTGVISDVLAVCDVLSPVRELEFFYSSEAGNSQKIEKNEKQTLKSQGKEPLHFLYLPKSARQVSSRPPHEVSISVESLNFKEKTSSNAHPSFVEDVIENPEFHFGLSLLQANILVLCIKAGVDPQTLYPPEALLLNLDVLQQKTIDYLSTHDSSSIHSSPPVVTQEGQLHDITSQLPSSLQRLIDPHPSHDQQQQLEALDLERNSSLEEDGVFISHDSDYFDTFDQPLPLEDFSKIISSDDRVGVHVTISSPMREYEEKVESDGQEWSFIEEAEEIGNYYR